MGLQAVRANRHHVGSASVFEYDLHDLASDTILFAENQLEKSTQVTIVPRSMVQVTGTSNAGHRLPKTWDDWGIPLQDASLG
ncbi:hypothetical protein E2562_010798 [Oryza meyeriana var. granulata]|uniref:Uncharacterized protein n=1 Tax=Oryza meyeriana var. granulata TaxID=110450 RepID=A0A6G1BJB6_9ORYZ|nr:hypothetical protein E2562_010798 [Oryza meyeriana var. granulata]